MIEEVAKEYGFRHVITTADIARALPSAVPFWSDLPGAGPYPIFNCKYCLPLQRFGHLHH